MDEAVIEKIELENGQTVIIKDLSKKISEDAYQVTLEASVKVLVEQGLFSAGSLGDTSIESVIKKVGDHVMFEHRVERNFIMANDRDAVFKKLVDTFNTTLVPYLSKPEFPAKLVLKAFRE